MTKLIDLKDFLSESNLYLPGGVENEDLYDFLKIFDEPAQFEGETGPIGFSDIKQFIEELCWLWSIDLVPDVFLDKLSYLLAYDDGHYRTNVEKRSRLKDLIYEYKRKGTIRSFKAIAIELGVRMWVYNNVYKPIVTSYQGQLSGYVEDQFKTCTGRTKDLLPSTIYKHDGFLQDREDIHEGILDVIFTSTHEFERLKFLVNKIAPAGFIVRYTDRLMSHTPAYVPTFNMMITSRFSDLPNIFRSLILDYIPYGTMDEAYVLNGFQETMMRYAFLDLPVFKIFGNRFFKYSKITSEDPQGLLSGDEDSDGFPLSSQYETQVQYTCFDLPVFSEYPKRYLGLLLSDFKYGMTSTSSLSGSPSGSDRQIGIVDCLPEVQNNVTQLSLLWNETVNFGTVDYLFSNVDLTFDLNVSPYSFESREGNINFG